MSKPKWEAERQYWIDAKEGTFIGYVFEHLPYYRDLCAWFVEIPQVQHVESAEEFKEALETCPHSFEERDFDKVDRAHKEYLEFLKNNTQD